MTGTALLLLLANAMSGQDVRRLTATEISDAYGIPMNEELSAKLDRGAATDLIVFPQRFDVKACSYGSDVSAECTFRVKWKPHGAWHPKRGRFLKRADGTWIADEASRRALYE